MGTFRELAGRHISDARDELTSHGEICDGHGVLEGAMVDATEAAVHEWLIAEFGELLTAGAMLRASLLTTADLDNVVDVLTQRIKQEIKASINKHLDSGDET